MYLPTYNLLVWLSHTQHIRFELLPH